LDREKYGVTLGRDARAIAAISVAALVCHPFKIFYRVFEECADFIPASYGEAAMGSGRGYRICKIHASDFERFACVWSLGGATKCEIGCPASSSRETRGEILWHSRAVPPKGQLRIVAVIITTKSILLLLVSTMPKPETKYF
jgi:hypothetical protein